MARLFYQDGHFKQEIEPDAPEEYVWNPCEVCHERGPCGHDAEGRPLFHWEPPADADDQ